jgi:hypothetical protein
MEDTADNLNYYSFAFWGIMFLIFFLVMRHIYPDGKYYFPYSIPWIFGIIWFVSVGKSILWRSRYYGHHVCVDGIHGSIYGKPDFVPDPSMNSDLDKNFHWAVFNLGFSLLPPLRGKLGTLVLPANQLYEAGKNYIALTLCRKWELSQLPHAVSSHLRDNSNDYNLENIYYGKYSRNFIDNSGMESDLNTQIRTKDALIDSLLQTIKNKFAHYEELKTLVDIVGGKENWFKKVLGRVKSKEEDE